MSTSFAIATVNDGTTAISSATSGTGVKAGGTTNGVVCNEALGILHCSAVAAAGIFVVTLDGSTDGGTTWVQCGSFGSISATGAVTIRMHNVPPDLRWTSTKTSGTSVTCVIDVIGVVPTDSALATSV